MFAWLGLALIIDGIDGTFARLAHVEERLPRSGERLDLVVDYVTYVFVPALALLRAGYLTGAGRPDHRGADLAVVALSLLDLASKGEDDSLSGPPPSGTSSPSTSRAVAAGPAHLGTGRLRSAHLRAHALGASDAGEALTRLALGIAAWAVAAVAARRAWAPTAVVDADRARRCSARCLGTDVRALAASAPGRLTANRAPSAGTHPTPAFRRNVPPGIDEHARIHRSNGWAH